jgi:hypothetical protein
VFLAWRKLNLRTALASDLPVCPKVGGMKDNMVNPVPKMGL